MIAHANLLVDLHLDSLDIPALVPQLDSDVHSLLIRIVIIVQHTCRMAAQTAFRMWWSRERSHGDLLYRLLLGEELLLAGAGTSEKTLV